MKLDEWLSIWLNKYMKLTIKQRTYHRYEDIIMKHINPLIGNYELEELTGEVLQDFVIKKRNSGNLITYNGLSDNTVLAIVSVLKQSIKYAHSIGLCKIEHTAYIKLPIRKEKPIIAFERSEQHKIEMYCLKSKRKNYLGIIVCLYTGIRLGELLALTWNDINFEKKLLTINKTVYTIKEDGKNYPLVTTPKTSNSIRVIPIPKELLVLLKKQKKESKSDYIIATRAGGIVQNRSYQKSFKSVLRKCKISHRKFHVLRHTFATRALESGMDVKTLSEILGHKNAIITLNRYSHSMMNYKIEMMNRIGKLLIV